MAGGGRGAERGCREDSCTHLLAAATRAIILHRGFDGFRSASGERERQGKNYEQTGSGTMAGEREGRRRQRAARCSARGWPGRRRHGTGG